MPASLDAVPDSVSSISQLQSRISELWAHRSDLDPADSDVVEPIHEAVDALDTGAVRVAEIGEDGAVRVNQWCKQAILLLFRHIPDRYCRARPFRVRRQDTAQDWLPETGSAGSARRVGSLGQLPSGPVW